MSRGLLLACLFLPGPVVADPGTIGRILVEQSGLQNEAVAIDRRIAGRLNDTPLITEPVHLYRESTAVPMEFTGPILAFTDELRSAGLAGADFLPYLLDRQWPRQAGIAVDCPRDRLPPPASLDVAAEQVIVLAEAVAERQRAALNHRGRQRLANDFARVYALLENPQPAQMSWWERRRLKRYLKLLNTADLQRVQCAADQWLALLDRDWLGRVRSLMASSPAADDRTIFSRESSQGAVVFTGRAGGKLTTDKALAIFDLGGDDFYGLESTADFAGFPTLLVDFAGDDTYQSSRPGGYAAGLGRVAILQDHAGDDIYRGPGLVQGVGWLGVGILHDLQGSDEYHAANLSQGVALYGLGLLLDEAGDDHYTLQSLGQGLGLPRGMGLLVDGEGRDVYRALGGRPSIYGTAGLTDGWAQGVGLGLRGLAAGGLGLLLDAGGADHYEAGNYAQGGGYFRGVGELLDMGAGDDILQGTRYAQGWGAHGGIGFLFNEAGDDRYAVRHSVMAGLAWDYSMALFHDAAGNDSYDAGDFSLGASAHGSIAWFIDSDGSDDYRGTLPARHNESPPNFSIFMDRGRGNNQLNGKSPQTGCELSHDHGFLIWARGERLPACVDARK